jgi:hypothetical protein
MLAAHLIMASSTEENMKALLKVLVDCAEDATKSLGGLVDHALDHMHDEEIVARTLFAMKEKLELLQQDALEAKVQAFLEIAKYEWDDISVQPTSPSTLQQLLIHLLMKRSSTAPMSVMSGTSAILIGLHVIATGILLATIQVRSHVDRTFYALVGSGRSGGGAPRLLSVQQYRMSPHNFLKYFRSVADLLQDQFGLELTNKNCSINHHVFQ